ncbi:lipopolysaccharide biosynthesis protein [Allonocardiopsis opalescens]|uniref:O-antigen/teichoic acid export membrane protein n=1 Tax=Allonocardiopsis opalescens TaxID=1144618 RepID=A0A2T0QD14_9ACTN|nr:lipopolysaccharide biosynthesis protein [Allonocardiopsis opalescens]PRY01846.1 O-antigen/teichoic acid export membrane protein [Allonocardiopsis opalescens]
MSAPAPSRAAETGAVLRGGVLNMAGALVGAALNVAIVVAVTRTLSTAEAGVFFSATSVFVIAAAAASLGCTTGLVYFIARVRARGAPWLVVRVLRIAFGPVLAVSALVGAALYACAPALAEGLLPGAPPHTATYLRTLAPFLPLAVLTDSCLAATRGLRVMRATVYVERVARPGAQLALLLAVASSGGAGLLAVAWAGPYLPAAALAAFWLHRLLRRHPGAAEPAAAGAETVRPRAFWGFTLPRSLADLAQINVQRLGIVLVGALQGAAEAAVFTAATRFLVVGQFGNQALGNAVSPRLSELLAVDERAGARHLYEVSTAWLICVNWPLYLTATVYAPLLLAVFGDGYTEGAAAMALLAAALLAATGCGMSDLALTMAGKTVWNLVNQVAALAVNVALCVVLVPRLGIAGAALGWAGAILVRSGLPLLQLRGLGLRPLSRAAAAAAAACLVWFLLLPLAAQALLGDGLGTAAATLAAAAAGYLATLWRWRAVLSLRELPLVRRLERWGRARG